MTAEMQDEVDRVRDLIPHRLIRQLDTTLDAAGRESRERLLGRVRVNGRERPGVAGVEGLEQVERLAAAHLADDDPIGSVTERGSEQVANRDGRQIT